MLDNVRSLHKRRKATQARLERVEGALSGWDQIAEGNLLPPEARPDIRRPVLGPKTLESLRGRLLGELGEIDRVMERRN